VYLPIVRVASESRLERKSPRARGNRGKRSIKVIVLRPLVVPAGHFIVTRDVTIELPAKAASIDPIGNGSEATKGLQKTEPCSCIIKVRQSKPSEDSCPNPVDCADRKKCPLPQGKLEIETADLFPAIDQGIFFIGVRIVVEHVHGKRNDGAACRAIQLPILPHKTRCNSKCFAPVDRRRRRESDGGCPRYRGEYQHPQDEKDGEAKKETVVEHPLSLSSD
jgi:hypothetical protein